MKKYLAQSLILGITVCAAQTSVRTALAQVGPERRFLLQEDLEIPGYEVVLAEATLGVGEREGRHTHPGTLVAHMLEGELTLELEGQPTVVLRPSDSILVEPGQVHEGINSGEAPVKALVTFIVKKDEPLSTEAQ